MSNSVDHQLVRTEKEPTLSNGYDNEGFRTQGDDEPLKPDMGDHPLDTRLHHYVAVDEVARTLNGDSYVQTEGIPMEPLDPEKASLEKKNGASWDSYGESHFIAEKLNGTSKSREEVISIPVNSHRKCLSREGSDSNCSEHKFTGEKLYISNDNRKLFRGWRRLLICGVVLIIIAVALLLGILAATGILMRQSETRHESSHSLDSIAQAGHSFRLGASSDVPQKFLTSPVTHTTVTSKVPASQTIVPNALVGEFTIIDENFTDDLKDNTSSGYDNLARNLEKDLSRIFKAGGARFDSVKILKFRPGSIRVKFVIMWSSSQGIVFANNAFDVLANDLRKKNNTFYNLFTVDIDSIHFIDVFDECLVQKGGCSYNCIWDYDTLLKTCTCPNDMELLKDETSCGPVTTTSTVRPSSTEVTTPSSFSLKKVETIPPEAKQHKFPEHETTIPAFDFIPKMVERNDSSLEKDDGTFEKPLPTTTVDHVSINTINSSTDDSSINHTTTKQILQQHTTNKNVERNDSTLENDREFEKATTVYYVPIDTFNSSTDDSSINPTTTKQILQQHSTNKTVERNDSTLEKDRVFEKPTTIDYVPIDAFNSSTNDSFINHTTTTLTETVTDFNREAMNIDVTTSLSVATSDTQITNSTIFYPDVANDSERNSTTFRDSRIFVLNDTTPATFVTDEHPTIVEEEATLRFHLKPPITEIYTLRPYYEITTPYTTTTVEIEMENGTESEILHSDNELITTSTEHPEILNATTNDSSVEFSSPKTTWQTEQIWWRYTNLSTDNSTSSYNETINHDITSIPLGVENETSIVNQATTLMTPVTELNMFSASLSSRTPAVRSFDNFTDIFENFTIKDDPSILPNESVSSVNSSFTTQIDFVNNQSQSENTSVYLSTPPDMVYDVTLTEDQRIELQNLSVSLFTTPFFTTEYNFDNGTETLAAESMTTTIINASLLITNLTFETTTETVSTEKDLNGTNEQQTTAVEYGAMNLTGAPEIPTTVYFSIENVTGAETIHTGSQEIENFTAIQPTTGVPTETTFSRFFTPAESVFQPLSTNINNTAVINATEVVQDYNTTSEVNVTLLGNDTLNVTESSNSFQTEYNITMDYENITLIPFLNDDTSSENDTISDITAINNVTLLFNYTDVFESQTANVTTSTSNVTSGTIPESNLTTETLPGATDITLLQDGETNATLIYFEEKDMSNTITTTFSLFDSEPIFNLGAQNETFNSSEEIGAENTTISVLETTTSSLVDSGRFNGSVTTVPTTIFPPYKDMFDTTTPWPFVSDTAITLSIDTQNRTFNTSDEIDFNDITSVVNMTTMISITDPENINNLTIFSLDKNETTPWHFVTEPISNINLNNETVNEMIRDNMTISAVTTVSSHIEPENSTDSISIDSNVFELIVNLNDTENQTNSVTTHFNNESTSESYGSILNTTDYSLSVDASSTATENILNETVFTLEAENGTSTIPYFMYEEMTTISPWNESDSNSSMTSRMNKADNNYTDLFSIFQDENFNLTDSNYTVGEDLFNFTTTGYDDLNETTTNATTGLACREDQFICEPLTICLNMTLMCDGIIDCPDKVDESDCEDTCYTNFQCSNSSTCIMSSAHCDGIWDCLNGTDEENCMPIECAKHEVMCSDNSKCIRPSDICDSKYDCNDRSDEVGCVERTTCETGGKFFCNDGLCIPWSLKCDGEFDCKDKDDEANCTCLNDEFQCNDGKCLKSSSRCDGHADCHDADDEMGCVNVDTQYIVTTFEPYSGSWAMLCAEDWNLDDGHYLCQELGFGHALKTEKIPISFNGTWMAMRRENLTDSSLWTERVSFVESCTSSLAAAAYCQKFACGEYTGLLHRRKRETQSTSSQWPFVGYTSTFHSNKGCLSEILTPIWLITSEDCLQSLRQPFNGTDWYVRTNLGATEAGQHEVLRIVSHPHSSRFRSLVLRDYDVALVRLKHALVFVSDKIGAICPPEEQVAPGITCFSGVLGAQTPRVPPPSTLTISSLALQIIERKNCNTINHYNNQVNQRMLCTQSSEGHAICDNDEGTPLMCLTGINKWFLAGMLTYHRYCEVYSKHPAVFSNLFSMRKFIDKVTGQKQYEIPYDNGVYSIIPPTTPMPVMTTLPYTTLEYGNGTDNLTESAFNSTLFETLLDDFPDIEFTTVENADNSTITPSNFTSNQTTMEYIGTDIASNYTLRGTTMLPSIVARNFTHLNETVLDMEEDWNITNTGDSNFTSDLINLHGENLTEKVSSISAFNFSDGIDKMHVLLPSNRTLPSGGNSFINSTDFEYESEIDNSTTNLTLLYDPAFFPEISYDAEPEFSHLNESFANALKINDTSPVESAKLVTTTKHLSVGNDSVAQFQNNASIPIILEPISVLKKTSTDDTTLNILTERNISNTQFENNTSNNTTATIILQPMLSLNSTITSNSSFVLDYKNDTEIIPVMLSETTLFGNNKTNESIIEHAPEDYGFTRRPLMPETGKQILETLTTETTTARSNIKPELIAENEKLHSLDKNFTIESTNREVIKLQSEPGVINDHVFTFMVPKLVPEELEENITAKSVPNETSTETTTSMSSKTIPMTLILETEVGTDNDLAMLAFNDSEGIVVKPVKGISDFEHIESDEMLTRSRKLSDTVNASDIYYENNPGSKDYENTTRAPSSISDISVLNLTDRTLPEPSAMSKHILYENVNTTSLIPAFNSTSLSYEHVNMSGNVSIAIENNSEFSITTVAPLFEVTELYENATTATGVISELNTTTPSPMTENMTLDGNVSMAENTSSLYFDENVTPLIEHDGTVPSDPFFTMLHVGADTLMVADPENSTLETCGMWGNSTDSNTTEFYAEWPSLGYLQMITETKMCAATLLSSQYVITSLSCLSTRDPSLDPQHWAFVAGSLDSSSDGYQNHMITDIIGYPKAVPGEHNVALVKLKDEIYVNPFSQAACLPQGGIQDCYTAGWTKNNSADDRNEEFFSVPVNITATDECNYAGNNYSGRSFICAHNKHSCQMAPGTALYCRNERGQWEIRGLLHISNPCDLQRPAVYNNLDPLRGWIQDIL